MYMYLSINFSRICSLTFSGDPVTLALSLTKVNSGLTGVPRVDLRLGESLTGVTFSGVLTGLFVGEVADTE